MNQNDQIRGVTFEDFLKTFSTDSNYQSSSVSFPVEYVSYDEDDKVSTSYVPESEWKFEEFSKDNLAKKRDVDAFEGIIATPDSTTGKYTRQGIDNGILIEYLFVKKENGWRLVRIEDRSIDLISRRI